MNRQAVMLLVSVLPLIACDASTIGPDELANYQHNRNEVLITPAIVLRDNAILVGTGAIG